MKSWGYYISFCRFSAIFSQCCDASIICVLGSTSKFFVLHVCKKWVRTHCCAPNCRVIVNELQLLHYYALLCHYFNLASSLTSFSYEWCCIDLWIYLQVCTYTYLWIYMWIFTKMWSHHCIYFVDLFVNLHLHTCMWIEMCACARTRSHWCTYLQTCLWTWFRMWSHHYKVTPWTQPCVTFFCFGMVNLICW